MNHTQRVFTGALATLTALVWAIPAKSSDVQPISAIDHYSTARLIELGVKPGLAYTVEAAGIPVLDGATIVVPNPCKPHPDRTVFGFYAYELNVIVMCSNNIHSVEQFTETFTHEAVHLMQDCRAGIDNDILYVGPQDYIDRLWYSLSPDHQQNIINAYVPDDYNIEIEAFALMDEPYTVERGVQKFCFA